MSEELGLESSDEYEDIYSNLLTSLDIAGLKSEDFTNHKDVFGTVEAIVDNIIIIVPNNPDAIFNPIDQKITVCSEDGKKFGLIYDVFGPIDMHRYNMIVEKSHLSFINQGDVFYFNRNSCGGLAPMDPNTIKGIETDEEDDCLHN